MTLNTPVRMPTMISTGISSAQNAARNVRQISVPEDLPCTGYARTRQIHHAMMSIANA